MLKGEIEILALIVLNKSSSKQIATGRIARNSPYIVSTLNTLKQKKYIIENRARKYQITGKGIRALAEFYPSHPALNKEVHKRLVVKQASEAIKAIKMIESLSNQYNSRINPADA